MGVKENERCQDLVFLTREMQQINIPNQVFCTISYIPILPHLSISPPPPGSEMPIIL